MLKIGKKVITQQQLDLLLELTNLKDRYTVSHSEHVMYMSALIYDNLDNDLKRKVNKKKLMKAALFHDVGKIYLSDRILLKAGKLTNEEIQEMKLHTIYGQKILLGTRNNDLAIYAKTHHERQDGKGYWSLNENQMPIESKIIAIADSYSAMTTKRPYKEPMAINEAVAEIEKCSGSQFDPIVVKAFLKIDILKLIEARDILAEQYVLNE